MRQSTTGLGPKHQPVSLGLPWEALVEPSRVFARPQDVVVAPDLSRDEKRAILASWASDTWAVESAPSLRRCPGLTDRSVSVDAVLEALISLDPDATQGAWGKSGLERRPRDRGVRWLSLRSRRTREPDLAFRKGRRGLGIPEHSGLVTRRAFAF
jgi:hypothetical protein